jgi:hypothetical protein
LIEQTNRQRVEIRMTQARGILVSLIPTLLLVASVNCLGASMRERADQHLADCSLAAASGSRHTTSACDISFEQTARRWARRLQIHTGGNGLVSPATIGQWQLALPSRTIDLCDWPPGPDLAQCWQFQWRTAFDPRAPSTVS